MKTMVCVILAVILIPGYSAYGYQSLQEVFDDAPPGMFYDKALSLNPDIEYEGDLIIPAGLAVQIVGNGAKIFGNYQRAAIIVNGSQLHISGCIIIGGDNGLSFMDNSEGKIFNNTIINPDSSAVWSYYPNTTRNLEIYDNIFVDGRFGIAAIENYLPSYIGYNIVYSCSQYSYAEFCPG